MIFILESCHTTSGGAVGVACVFPFIFRDKSRNSCIFEDSDSGEAWCSVQVDKEGYHIGNKGEMTLNNGLLEIYKKVIKETLEYSSKKMTRALSAVRNKNTE